MGRFFRRGGWVALLKKGAVLKKLVRKWAEYCFESTVSEKRTH